jgi:hypothetical protein
MVGMSRGKQYAVTGEEIHLSVNEAADAQDSVLQFLAVLAYPQPSEKQKRDPFAEALHAAVYKTRVWERRTDKHDSVALRTLVPEEYRRKTNRKYQGLINKGMRRVDARLTAGGNAARFCFSGLRIPASRLGKRSSVIRPGEPCARIPITFLRSYENVNQGIEFIGPETVRDALRDAIGARDRKRGILHYGANQKRGLDDAIENHRKSLWIPSMPVLHLAMALFDELCNFPKGYETPGAEFLMGLLQDSTWLRNALVRAEGYRNILAERIPEGEFDPVRAIRLLPQ